VTQEVRYAHDSPTPTSELTTVRPTLTQSKRLALAGFLTGYRGLTLEASRLLGCTLALLVATSADGLGWVQEACYLLSCINLVAYCRVNAEEYI
jgi:hypothetical protein